MVSIDYTLFIQAGLFIFLMLVLNAILFKPFLRFLEDRHHKISGDEREAARLQEEAERRRLQVDERLHKGQLKALEEKGRIQDTGVQAGKQVVNTVHQEVEEEMRRVKAQIAKEGQKALSELELRRGAMAKGIAEKILGRSIR